MAPPPSSTRSPSPPTDARRRARRRAGLAGAAALSLSLAAPAPVRAQDESPRVQPEARLDVLAARATALHAGLGLTIRAGRYARLSLVGAGGPAFRGGEARAGGRADLLARIVLDPEFDTRWSPYAAAGASVRRDAGAPWRELLVLLLGLEGPRGRAGVPFLEAGYGGGLRLGLGLRRALPDRR
jgi:hypothetical protein